MEVTTVSPSPPSPSEGADLCEINVTTVAIHSVTLLICICGLAGNGAVLWLLGSHCSSRNTTILSIHNLTVLDFLLLLFLLPSTLLFLLEDMSCSIIMPLRYVGGLFRVSPLLDSIWLCTLTLISIQRCRSIHCLLWHCCHHPRHLSWVMFALFGAVSIAFLTVCAAIYILCVFQLSEYCWFFYISIHAFDLFLSTPVMLISSTILFIHFKPGSQQQQHRRLDIVIILVALFSLPLSLWSLLQQFSYTAVPSQVVFLLTCITSSIKPFIYFLVGSWKRAYCMGSCWRHCSMESCRRHSSMQSLRKVIHRVFEEPNESTARRDDPAMDTRV